MKRILVEELKPEMRFSAPVYIDKDNVLAGANVPIMESDIKRLMKWGIRDVYTEGDLVTATAAVTTDAANVEAMIGQYNRLLLMKDDVVRVHNQACEVVAKVHLAIRNGRNFPNQDVFNVALQIAELISQNHNAFIFLYGLGDGKDELVVHTVNSAFYALLIGRAMKYNRTQLQELGAGVLLLNAGMVQLPVYILHKRTNLTDHEFNQIKTHPLLGYQALKKFGDLAEKVALVSLHHHEQYDGKGYPMGIKGSEISEYARITAIADNYAALIEKKSYRDKQVFYQAMKQLVASGGRKFDPVILRIFISFVSMYPVGSIVRLNRRGTGVVIGAVPGKPMRPIVKLVLDEKGGRVHGRDIVNLLEDQSLFIVDTLDEKDVGFSVSGLL